MSFDKELKQMLDEMFQSFGTTPEKVLEGFIKHIENFGPQKTPTLYHAAIKEQEDLKKYRREENKDV